MRATLDLEVKDSRKIASALGPSLRDTRAATFDLDSHENLRVDIEAERTGALRGATNTVLMLTKLSQKMMEDQER